MENYDIHNESSIELPPFENYYFEESRKSISMGLYENYITESIDRDEGFGNVLRPVFIILLYSDSTFDHFAGKFVKNQSYWHAAIGFGPSLKRTYSFNFGDNKQIGTNKLKGGISFESLDYYKKEAPEGTMEVSCILLTKDRYDQLKDTLDYYMRNKEKTRYDFIGLAKSLFGSGTKNGPKMNLVCSTFVDTILRSVDINISGRNHSNLVKPDDLKKSRKHEKHFKLYSGKISGYNVDKATNVVDKLTQDENNDFAKEVLKDRAEKKLKDEDDNDKK